MFRLGTRATTAACAGELASLTFARGVRTRTLPATAKKAPVAPRPAASKPTTSKVPKAKGPPRAVLQAIPPARQPVYIEISHLVPVPEGTETKVAELDPDVFAAPIRRDILHLCVIQHLDNQRQGSANTKTRGEVRGSGRKVRPQKGTGKARLGDGQSPMLIGGGVAFGPRPRDFSTKLPRKVRAMGMRVALSSRVKEHSLMVVDSFEWQGIKTKDFKLRMQELSWGRCLFVVGRGDETFKRITRVSKIENLHIIKVQDLDLHTVLRWPKLVLDVEALEWLEQKWQTAAWTKVQTTFRSAPVVLAGHSLPPPVQQTPWAAVASL